MPGIVVQMGLQESLTRWTTKIVADSYQFCLYTNNHVPAVLDTVAAYTEATFPGYARVTAPATLPPVWDATASRYNQQFNGVAFTWSGSGSPPVIYGYFCLRNDGVLMFAENLWAAGMTLSVASPSAVFIPSIDSLNEF